MSVCVPSPCISSPSVDAANHNGPQVTPPTTLSLRSSHNLLLSDDVINQEQTTPPKCRKKYAHTSIQSAMGLGEGVTPPPATNADNPKLAKNGANRLRKAAEQQDHNRNTTEEDDLNTASPSELSIDEEDVSDDPVGELISDDAVQSQDPIISLEKTDMRFPESFLSSQLPDDLTKPLLEPSPRKPHSPEDTPLLSVGSSSSSSSPETKKDRPRTGAKTDRALNRIQNLPQSDEESSWTTLSQDSASLGSPEESSFWGDQTFLADSDLPPGWKMMTDSAGIYYWHIPTGTTQWERPDPCSADHAYTSQTQSPSPTPDHESHADVFFGATSRSGSTTSYGSDPSSGHTSSQQDPTHGLDSISSSSDGNVPSCGFVNSCYFPRSSSLQIMPDKGRHSEIRWESERKQPWSVFTAGRIDSETWKDLQAATVTPDPSLKEFEGATLRYASLKLGNLIPVEEEDSSCINSDPEAKCFAVRSLGWVEMAEEDLAPGKSSVAVNNCIRQLSYCKNDIRDTVGIWGEGKDMYLTLENNMLNLVDPSARSVLHSQPITSIRVWGVGRDNGRDFAYVARDKDTRILKCHVFRCDTPAKAIATSLHQICSRIMAERKVAKALGGGSLQDRLHMGPEVPLQEFPTPKTELVQKFQVMYVGMMAVARPLGMEIINSAIDSLMTSSERDDWRPVMLNVADATVTVIREKANEREREEVSVSQDDEVLLECRVRFLSFMGVGRDVRSFAFIMDSGNQHFECHVFWCEPNAGGVSEAVQAACVLRYQKCLVARPLSQKALCQAPPPDSVTRRVSTSVKRGVLSLIDTLKQKRPAAEPPQ